MKTIVFRQAVITAGVLLGVAVLRVLPAQAASMGFYSVDKNSNELVSIEADTGTVSVIGRLGVDVNDIDLTILDGKLYGLNSNFPAQQVTLLDINPETGAATSLGTLLRGTDRVTHAEGLAAKNGKLFVGFTTASNDVFSYRLGELLLDGTVVNDLDLGVDRLGATVDLDGLASNASGLLFNSDAVTATGTMFLNPPNCWVRIPLRVLV